jgi:hypothetical protein
MGSALWPSRRRGRNAQSVAPGREAVIQHGGISGMKQPTPAAATLLHDRNTTLHTLRTADALLLWTPRMVDVALTKFPGVSDIADLADSAAFHAACEEGNRIFSYSVASWAPPFARTSLADGKLAQLYVERQVRAALSDLRLNPQSVRHILPDAAGMVRSFWASLAPGYRAGIVVGDKLVSWGWEAYLARRLTPMVAGAIGRGLNWAWSAQPMDDERDDFDTTQPEDRWEGHLRHALVRALDQIITDGILRDAYFALAYSEEAMGEVAASLGVNYHYLHTRLMVPLCQRIAKAADRPMQGHVRICLELRAALAEVLPMTVFTDRYAASLPLPPKIETLPQQNPVSDSNSPTDCQ